MHIVAHNWGPQKLRFFAKFCTFLDLERSNFEILKKKFLRPKIQVLGGYQPFRGGLKPFSGLRNRNWKIPDFSIFFIFFLRYSLFLALNIKILPKIPVDMNSVLKL